MRSTDWLQLAFYVGVLALITKPMGLYLVQVLDASGRTWFDPILKPLERLTYRLMAVKSDQEQDWKAYTFAMLLFSLVSCLFTYAILRLQHLLPLNPQGFGPVSPDLAFNTATSFTTNTNWQSYTGESTMSYLSQMVALVIHNFSSAATGIAIAAALVRAIARHSAQTLGNFWVDLVRTTYYLLLPICVVFAVFLVSQGMLQNFKPYTKAKLTEPFTIQVAKTDEKGQPVTTNVAVMVQAPKLDAKGQPVFTNGVAMMVDVPKLDEKGQPVMTNMPVMVDQKVEEQVIAQGPVASQVAIKMLGTNGGGFMNANAAHPFENPTPLSNFIQILSIFAIGSGLTYYLGRMVKNQAHGWSVWAAMMTLFLAGVFLCWYAEAAGNPIHQQLGVAAAGGNMEGKEVRFGIFNSALFATITTDASCGAVNSMHDSFTALGGFVPLFNIQLGEIIIGGVGAGLYGMLVFVVLAVFIAGLMVGRTPEYLGKKIQSYDVKMAMLALLVLAVSILGFAAWASVSKWGLAGLNNNGPHGLSEILYAFSSANGNNGSAFAGLNANTPWYNTTIGLAMLVGRFLMIVPIMALAGSLAAKKIAPPSAGTFPVSGLTFVILLLGTVLLVGALNFLPGLTLGPIVEHFLTGQGKLY
ncbi:MAG TPA: potassium-transporting ATPase subunit KdpA [Candidatus Binatia bacterium]|jgi:K+-transporting ATPase ATPase A chain|nr:potassium-transporting ATPase subunit KdpA [Candidatus Binatia bacterium]